MNKTALFLFLSMASLLSCNARPSEMEQTPNKKMTDTGLNTDSTHADTATFGAGCFWCVEAVFLELKGVNQVASGYMGGQRANPTYEQVCSGATGHAEVIQLVFDPQVISYPELLEVFWSIHDPTTLNRQGADVGTQYRSVVFYHSDTQKELATEYKQKLDQSGAFPAPIVTEISAATVFYKAEAYHQNYYNTNGNQPYCSLVIRPKVEKFRKVFGGKLR